MDNAELKLQSDFIYPAKKSLFLKRDLTKRAAEISTNIT